MSIALYLIGLFIILAIPVGATGVLIYSIYMIIRELLEHREFLSMSQASES